MNKTLITGPDKETMKNTRNRIILAIFIVFIVINVALIFFEILPRLSLLYGGGLSDIQAINIFNQIFTPFFIINGGLVVGLFLVLNSIKGLRYRFNEKHIEFFNQTLFTNVRFKIPIKDIKYFYIVDVSKRFSQLIQLRLKTKSNKNYFLEGNRVTHPRFDLHSDYIVFISKKDVNRIEKFLSSKNIKKIKPNSRKTNVKLDTTITGLPLFTFKMQKYILIPLAIIAIFLYLFKPFFLLLIAIFGIWCFLTGINGIFKKKIILYNLALRVTAKGYAIWEDQLALIGGILFFLISLIMILVFYVALFIL